MRWPAPPISRMRAHAGADRAIAGSPRLDALACAASRRSWSCRQASRPCAIDDPSAPSSPGPALTKATAIQLVAISCHQSLPSVERRGGADAGERAFQFGTPLWCRICGEAERSNSAKLPRFSAVPPRPQRWWLALGLLNDERAAVAVAPTTAGPSMPSRAPRYRRFGPPLKTTFEPPLAPEPLEWAGCPCDWPP